MKVPSLVELASDVVDRRLVKVLPYSQEDVFKVRVSSVALFSMEKCKLHGGTDVQCSEDYLAYSV